MRNESVKIVKSLMKSLRDNANYFDELHEYDRMNELDKVYKVFDSLIPVIEDILVERKDMEYLDKKYGEDSHEKVFCYPVLNCHVDNLLSIINDVKEMKPFGEKVY